MLNRIIDVALSARWIVLMLALALIAGGSYAIYTMPVEAFPDFTNNQVTVVTEAPSMPPTEVEQLVTYPIEQAMMGMPKQQEVRSLSKLGLSIITVVFDDSVSMYFARQMVNERLQQVTDQIPRGIQPRLGLPATAFGELYQYTLGGPMTAMELKDVQEWQIKRQLRTVPGVSEINNWGGEVKQYQIVVDPAVLSQYGLTLHDVAQRVSENNANFGGGYIEHNDEQYTLRGGAAHRGSRTSATSSCYQAAGFRYSSRMSPKSGLVPHRSSELSSATERRSRAWSSCSRARTVNASSIWSRRRSIACACPLA
jgi:cobalt-zinc-cadmium resistance protein CzcA